MAIDLDALLKDAKRAAFEASKKTPVSVKVEKVPIPRQADYTWTPGPTVALFINGEFLGMFQELTLERISARRLVHISEALEPEVTPTVVENLPWHRPEIPQFSPAGSEEILALKPDFKLLSDVMKRNARLKDEPESNVDEMLKELGFHEW